MYEVIVRVVRAVACQSRLRMLAKLAQDGELAPSQLARDLGMSLAITCTHLRRLASAGLVVRRRSGLWCYCRAESPYSEEALSGKVSRWLFDALKNARQTAENPVVVQLRDSPQDTAEAQAIRLVFDAATAFANVRRLQILKHLADSGPADVATLRRELHMSATAVGRHTAKLMRRGYVSATHTGRLLRYQLTREFKTPLHAALLGIIRAQWR